LQGFDERLPRFAGELLRVALGGVEELDGRRPEARLLEELAGGCGELLGRQASVEVLEVTLDQQRVRFAAEALEEQRELGGEDLAVDRHQSPPIASATALALSARRRSLSLMPPELRHFSAQLRTLPPA